MGSLYLQCHDKAHMVAAEAAAPAAALAAALAAAPADPWIHGSISFIINHIFYFEMKNKCMLNYINQEQQQKHQIGYHQNQFGSSNRLTSGEPLKEHDVC